ncbi:MAG: hypothetical protein SGI99_00940 [Pseudomonadota bacterium]|nr:hypothetical protein [Pseudomonadota bacterium]
MRESTGDAFVAPIIVALIIGRIGYHLTRSISVIPGIVACRLQTVATSVFARFAVYRA